MKTFTCLMLAQLSILVLIMNRSNWSVMGSVPSRTAYHVKGNRLRNREHQGNVSNKRSSKRSLQNIYDNSENALWAEVDLRKKTKGKGKGGKSKKRPITPAPSISHQPSTSTMPSSHPSISTMPSSRPTSKPSSQPSSQPSPSPSSSPSAHPSSTPTFFPSSSPSQSPSDIPSDAPSLTPSSIPSLNPTTVPSLQPSYTPSQFPSDKPSVSSSPSSSPSISSMPSFDNIQIDEVIYDESGNEIGIKSACKAPKEIESVRYAEKNVQEAKVEFKYIIRIMKIVNSNNEANDAISNVVEDDILQLVDYQLHSYVYAKYIQCQGLLPVSSLSFETRNRRRRIQLLENGSFYNKDIPIGVSSLPRDKISDEKCLSTDNGNDDIYSCLIVDGGLSLFYEKEADFNPSHEKNLLLPFIKDAMNDNTMSLPIYDNQYRIETEFIPGGIVDRGETIVGRIVDDDGLLRSEGQITMIGLMFIGSGIVILLGLLAAVVNRKRSIYAGLSEDDPVLSDILHEEDDLQDKGNMNGVTFPVGLPSVEENNHNGKKYLQLMVTSDPNVHYCSSSLCLQCKEKNSKIRFVRSTDWYDGDIVDGSSESRISDGTLDFSRPHMNRRSYSGNQDTVAL